MGATAVLARLDGAVTRTRLIVLMSDANQVIEPHQNANRFPNSDLTCSSDLEHGVTGAFTCFGSGTYPKSTKITAEAGVLSLATECKYCRVRQCDERGFGDSGIRPLSYLRKGQK